MRPAYLSSVAHILGEQAHAYRQAPTFDAVRARHAMPDMPALFGWGTYWRTAHSVDELMVRSVSETLARSGLRGADIDAIVLCSSNFQSGQVGDCLPVLERLQLTRAYPFGLAWGDCTLLLAGLDLARAQVQAGLKNVLVVSANRIEDEACRFQHYALFSDGAASCLVSAEPRDGYEILGSLVRSGPASAGQDTDAAQAALFREVNDSLLERQRVTSADLEQVLASNVFLPVLKIKEGRLGITASQLFTDNVAQMGHCFSADSLINLHSYEQQAQPRQGALLMLTANARGLRAQMLLRRVLPS